MRSYGIYLSFSDLLHIVQNALVATTCINLILNELGVSGITLTSILQIRKLRCIKCKKFVYRHTTGKWQNWDSKPNSLNPQPVPPTIATHCLSSSTLGSFGTGSGCLTSARHCAKHLVSHLLEFRTEPWLSSTSLPTEKPRYFQRHCFKLSAQRRLPYSYILPFWASHTI